MHFDLSTLIRHTSRGLGEALLILIYWSFIRQGSQVHAWQPALSTRNMETGFARRTIQHLSGANGVLWILSFPFSFPRVLS